jgi:SGNH hydrolase-like domain, acetyltransferase AlgX
MNSLIIHAFTKSFAPRALTLAFGLALAAGSAELLVRIAASMSFDVRYLATAGVAYTAGPYKSLEDYLANFGPTLAPHRVVSNYYTNALGFADREFSVDKPTGTLRIMGLGDSFTFGSVSYPDNVLTRVADSLNRDCIGQKFEIMNFGVPSAGVAEYRLVHGFAAPRYKPDQVVVHFYLGNDGPDLVSGHMAMPAIRPRAGHWSYAWTYVRNSITLLRSLDRGAVTQTAGATDSNVRGGERASDRPDLSDQDMEPTFTPAAFAGVLMDEVQRFYRGRGLPFAAAWNTTFEVLDLLKADVIARTGRLPIVVLYPSQAQIYPEVFESTEREIRELVPAVDLSDFDASFPNRMLLNYCERAGLTCHDITPALISASRAGAEPLYKPRDTHWNVRGNRLAAEEEAAFLRTILCPSG